MDAEKAHKMALFKYGIIAPVCGGFLSECSKAAYYRMAAQKEYTLPDGSSRKFSEFTLKKWAVLYQSKGIETLMPKGRSDAGVSRTITEDVGRQIQAYRKQFPKITGQKIYEKLLEEGHIRYGETSVDSVYRYLKAHGMTPEGMPPDECLSFEFDHANDCWQADTVDGPYLRADGMPARQTSGDYSYYVNDDGSTVTIAEYTGSEEVIEIPSEIDGYQVTDIGGKAFIYKEMKSLSVPDSVRSIGNRAFDNCVITDRLELPEGCHIWVDAFCYAELPSEIEIPSGTVVEDSAFSYCDTIKKVRVGSGADLKGRAFSYCDHLEEAVCASGCRLEKRAFEYCRELKKVTICGPVEMEEEAFSYCGDYELVEAGESDYGISRKPDLSSFLTGGKSGNLSGGWEVTRDCAVPEEAQEVFDRAMPDHDRMKYDAAALLAKQVVAGINYCFLRRTSVKDSDEQPTYQIVYIWQDPEGNAHVLDVKDITFGLDENSEQPQDGHSIRLTGEEDVFVDCPDSAKAGETVTVHTADVCDGVVRIEVNGSDTGTWEKWDTYTFIMPDEDVELNGRISTAGYPGA